MNYLAQLNDKKLLVLGLGKTGLSCVRFLMKHQQHCGYSVAVMDSRENPAGIESLASEIPLLQVTTGGWDSELLDTADLVIASPGIDVNQPEIANAIGEQTELIGDVEFFARLNTRPILAVTGSNGKSTVVSLLGYLGKACDVNTVIGGNFGTPVLDLLDQDYDLLVLELSSFQIELLESLNATAATVLNICEDHLDRHQTLANYQAIKLRLYQQTKVAVVNSDFPMLTPASRMPQFSFGMTLGQGDHFGLEVIDGVYWLTHSGQPLIKEADLPLAGRHNSYNVMAALALGYAAGWSLQAMVQALPEFVGLPHRCEKISTLDGICWINDSKATNVGATLAAVEGLAPQLGDDNQLILIAGGVGKGADFSELQDALNSHVGKLITLGKDGAQIAALKADSHQVDSLSAAVSEAACLAKPGDIVLLSPACASMDMFNNFEHRGLVFTDAVLQQAGGS